MDHLLRQPLRFQPYFRPMVWGGRKIARYLGKSLPANVAIGESWEVSDHPAHRTTLATASGYGATLRSLMLHARDALLGPAAERYSTFPWLIKILDACDWLSVQVHPDEAIVASLLPGEGAKTEAWLVLDAEPTSKIFAGLNPGVGKQEFARALEGGSVVECLHSFTPRVGDFIYLPAGTVHAVGGGVLLAEIQQTSDATFRLFDWNRTDSAGRPRPLHLEQGMASIDWNQGAITPISCGEGPASLLTSRYFAIDWVRASGMTTVGGVGQLQTLIVVEGRGRFSNGEYLHPGDVWVLPAAMPSMMLHLEAPLAGLRCTLP